MSRTFLISDLHLGHANILTFKDKLGNPIRPFENLDHMHETMIYRWNKVVKPEDKVYVLGDVAIKKTGLYVLDHMNGTKVLIRGNHDVEKLSVYQKYFKDVRGSHVLDRYILTHIPIHPYSLGRYKGNIHGHLHANEVTEDGNTDTRYFNVSVERIDYTPIDFEVIRKLMKDINGN